MSALSNWLFIWAAAAFATAILYILAASGRLYCAAIYLGHVWAVLKEEVARPWRVIKKAMSRKGVRLDEHERHIS